MDPIGEDSKQGSEVGSGTVAGAPGHLEKQQIFLRDGNNAYEIERPLFDTDRCIEFPKLK